jgi:hypothetical protein
MSPSGGSIMLSVAECQTPISDKPSYTRYVRKATQRLDFFYRPDSFRNSPQPPAVKFKGAKQMPRYYFHVDYGESSKPANEGIELPSQDDAWIEATTACGEIIRDFNGRLRPGDAWSMTVKDDAGTQIYLLDSKPGRYPEEAWARTDPIGTEDAFTTSRADSVAWFLSSFMQ